MLEIFPASALNSSVITTVWIGVAVVCLFNLRFGTTMSGLVVPGYLVPLLLTRPVSAVVIVAEGLVSYWLTVLLIDKVFQRFGASEMFGRDRFFALVLVSVVVRITADGWLLPLLGQQLTDLGYVFDYQANLHSVGLVIVALVANQMWNGGVRFGLPSLLLYTGVTYLIVRYGLMVFTNFSMSNLAFMYEDIASDILASPKAYIILLTTAYVASRLNLRYGWEFAGILIPALLALQWYQPLKLVATFFESFIILFGARMALRIPWLAQMNMEGARLLLLFFNIGFAYKLLAGFALTWLAPELKVSDYYAFGYLLSTLIAMKMHQKGILLKMSRAIVQTSLVGVLLASVAGFALSRSSQLGASIDAFDDETEVGQLRATDNLPARLNQIRAAAYASQPGGGIAPSPQELGRFEGALNALQRYRRRGDPTDLDRATQQLLALGFDVERVDTDYLLIADGEPRRGWGTFVLDLRRADGMLLEVPAPLDERGISEAAVALFLTQGYNGLALAGSRRETQGSAEPTRNAIAMFQRFHQLLGSDGALQLRGTRRDLGESVAGELWIKRRAPDDLRLARLEQLVGDLVVNWRERPYLNSQRAVMRDRFAELILSRQATRRLIGLGGQGAAVEQLAEDLSIDGYLYQWLVQSKQQLAPRDSNLYQSPDLADLLFLEVEVLQPLLELLAEGSFQPAALSSIAASARALDLKLTRYRQRSSGKEYLILAEPREPGPRRFWGTYVFRLGAASDFMIQVPRPLAETRSFEYGTRLFERLNASALLIAGAHPDANVDGSADVMDGANKLSLFNLTHQVLLKTARSGHGLVVQVRAFSPTELVAAPEIILSMWEGAASAQAQPLIDQLQQELNLDGQVVAATGQAETRGYDVRANAQTSFLRFVDEADLAVLWLSSDLRRDYRTASDSVAERNKFAALGIDQRELDLASAIISKNFSVLPSNWPQLQDRLRQYLATRDIVHLSQLQQASQSDLIRLLDLSSGQSHLIATQGDRINWACNLHPTSDEVLTVSTVIEPEQLDRFVRRRQGCLVGAAR